MEVKNIGKNVRMSQPNFGYVNMQAVQKEPIFLRLNLADEFKTAADAVSKKVSLEKIVENGLNFFQIKGPNFKRAIQYDEKTDKSNFIVFTRQVADAMFKAENSAAKA